MRQMGMFPTLVMAAEHEQDTLNDDDDHSSWKGWTNGYVISSLERQYELSILFSIKILKYLKRKFLHTFLHIEEKYMFYFNVWNFTIQ